MATRELSVDPALNQVADTGRRSPSMAAEELCRASVHASGEEPAYPRGSLIMLTFT